MRFLTKRLEELNVVSHIPSDQNKVYFGAWVTIENDSGEESEYRIVGPDEFDLSLRKLSMDSPLAKAMLGKRLDDEVIVTTPKGQQSYYITAIRYNEAAAL